MNIIIESVSKSQGKYTHEKAKEVVDVDEETKTDEKYVVKVMKSITRCMDDGVKEKKKDVPSKTSMKNTEILKKKTLHRTLVSKKRKVDY